jgi:hypothetical protein
MMFPEFREEIKSRARTGYHIIYRYEEDARIKYASRGITVCDDYFSFVNEIGFGSFFNSSFVLFSIDDDEGSVINTTAHLREIGFGDLVAVGYDGTTTGYFCLSFDPSIDRVYWVDVQFKTKEIIADSFQEWIESLPGKLFSDRIFAGFREIRNPEKVMHIILERRKFDVKLLSFDHELVRPPGKEKDMLPRYNRVLLWIRKKEESDLTKLTTIINREGSAVGVDNKQYVTLNVNSIPTGFDQKVETFVFDPFNLPFKSITCHFDYQIDLGSKTRVNYKEIADYL